MDGATQAATGGAWRRALAATLALACGLARAGEQSREDAWWTGPMLASGAATLPAGHLLFEPYVFDVHAVAAYDDRGDRHAVPAHDFTGSLSYLLYGFTDDLTAGLIPRFAFHQSGGGAAGGGVGLGDMTVHAAYRLARFDRSRHLPDVSLVVEHTFPTGRYQRLSNDNEGTGGGAHSTALAAYAQHYLWMPNGRILRARLNLTWTYARSTPVEGRSVYGTSEGFTGRAQPGNAFDVDVAGEYSLTQRWVVAMDLVYHDGDATRIDGLQPGPGTAPPAPPAPPTIVHASSGHSRQFGFAPAVECNLSARLGLLLGLRVLGPGRNATASVTPAVAINMVF